MQNEHKQTHKQGNGEQVPQRLAPDPPRDGEAIRTARIHTENLVRRTMDQMAHERARPRLRARAIADDAKSRVPEAMGYHEPMSPIPVLGRAWTCIEQTCKSVAATLGNISSALANSALDDPQAVLQVATMGRAAIESHAANISEMRGHLITAQAHAYDRAQRATSPPAPLAGVVSDARAALRDMTDKERSELMANARGQDREVLTYAVGGAPGFVTKSHDVKRTEFRNELLAIHDPELLELEPGIPLMLAALDKTEAGMRRLIGSVADFDSADALRKLRG